MLVKSKKLIIHRTASRVHRTASRVRWAVKRCTVLLELLIAPGILPVNKNLPKEQGLDRQISFMIDSTGSQEFSLST